MKRRAFIQAAGASLLALTTPKIDPAAEVARERDLIDAELADDAPFPVCVHADGELLPSGKWLIHFVLLDGSTREMVRSLTTDDMHEIFEKTRMGCAWSVPTLTVAQR